MADNYSINHTRIQKHEYKSNHTRLPSIFYRYEANVTKIPDGYFSVLDLVTQKLIVKLEFYGYRIPDNLWPDISEGKMFSNYLKSIGYDTDQFPTYEKEFGDGRTPKPVKLYPDELYPQFVKHFTEVWIKNHSYQYFNQRDPSAIKYLDIINGRKF